MEIAGGGVNCARCGGPIVPGEAWHLDHDAQTGRGIWGLRMRVV